MADRIIDRSVQAYALAWVDEHASPVKAVQAAYNEAAAQVGGRTPVTIEVTIRVAPHTDDRSHPQG